MEVEQLLVKAVAKSTRSDSGHVNSKLLLLAEPVLQSVASVGVLSVWSLLLHIQPIGALQSLAAAFFNLLLSTCNPSPAVPVSVQKASPLHPSLSSEAYFESYTHFSTILAVLAVLQ